MTVDTCAHDCARTPTPFPETNGLDRDDDRLATELFRRFGSVERGHFVGRDAWVAHADAVWEIAVTAPARRPWGSRSARLIPDPTDPSRPALDPDPLQVEATWQEGFDQGYELGRQGGGSVVIVMLLVGITAGILGGMVGWAIARQQSLLDGAVAGVGLWVIATSAVVAALVVVLAVTRIRRG